MRNKTPKSRKSQMQNLSERADSTRRLDKATTGYFESLSDVEFAEENSIAECLSRAAENIDIDSQTD